MKLLTTIRKAFGYFLLVPAVYLLFALLLSAVTVNKKARNSNLDKSIYLTTNGVHLSIVLPVKNIDNQVLSGIKYTENDKYLSFGWGDKDFYLNTPTWGDLTFTNAFKALFLKSSTLMHVYRYKNRHPNWVAIKVNQHQLKQLNTYFLKSFKKDRNGKKIILENQGYTSTDNFYKANGAYSCLKTSNTWVNTAFKKVGLKACLWTPFDFGLMEKYED